MQFTETLALEGLSASIGSVGDAYDNAAAETVFGLTLWVFCPRRYGHLQGAFTCLFDLTGATNAEA